VTVTSRTEALARYVKLAKEKKKEKAEDKSEAVMIAVGRMVHSCQHRRGVMDRSFISKKCCFHKDMAHHDVLQKCIEATWGDSAGNYYLSDGSGSKISDEGLLVRGGAPHSLPWSLGNFMRACNVYICFAHKALLCPHRCVHLHSPCMCQYNRILH
jgi:hypothetical protein